MMLFSVGVELLWPLLVDAMARHDEISAIYLVDALLAFQVSGMGPALVQPPCCDILLPIPFHKLGFVHLGPSFMSAASNTNTRTSFRLRCAEVMDFSHDLNDVLQPQVILEVEIRNDWLDYLPVILCGGRCCCHRHSEMIAEWAVAEMVVQLPIHADVFCALNPRKVQRDMKAEGDGKSIAVVGKAPNL